jgi:DNA polymerase elongation subunit (family B)
MELIEIKKFLHSRPGYLKEGGKRLRKLLLSKGFTTTIAMCKEAIRQVNTERREVEQKKVLLGERVLIYDIETSYNIVKSWRVGWNLTIQPGDILEERKIICVSYKWLGEDQVYNLSWDKDQDDRFLIEQFVEVLNEADVIVAHNGDRYDLKFIKTRALIHRIPMLINYPQFDTLKVAKKKFMFNSNRLDYISKVLGFEGKIETKMKLWDDVILRKSKEGLEKMLEYCDEDVVQLEKVYKELVSWETPKHHVGVLNGETKQTSPISGGQNLELVKTVTTNRGTVKHVMKDLDNGRLFEMSATNYKKYLLVSNK